MAKLTVIIPFYQKEPGILAGWQAADIYRKTREARASVVHNSIHSPTIMDDISSRKSSPRRRCDDWGFWGSRRREVR